MLLTTGSKRDFYTNCLRQTARMPYFTFTRLNLYLDLLSVIGFRHFKALLKVLNKRMQIAQFLRIYFEQFFAQLTFSVFLEFWSFWKYFSIFEFAVAKGFKKHVKLFIFRALFSTCFAEQLDFAINIWNFANLLFFCRLVN